MKTMSSCAVATMGLAMALACGHRAFADASPTPESGRGFTGIATAIDVGQRTMSVKGYWRTRTFNLASDCAVSLQDKPEASLADLRPGQSVQVRYDRPEGVLIAHRVAQRNTEFTGHVKAMDPAKHTLTLHSRGVDKTFQIAADCRILLRGDKPGILADVQPGHRVKVTYEVPDGKATAREIAQTSETFSGALTAIDLTDRTLKAKALLRSRTFHLADDCNLVIHGQARAGLSDLRLGEVLDFDYENVHGVNIVNRIASTGRPPESSSTASAAGEGSAPELSHPN